MAWYQIMHESYRGGHKILDWEICEHQCELHDFLQELEKNTYVILDNCHYYDSKRRAYISNTEWDNVRTGQLVLRCDRIIEVEPLVGHPAEIKLTGKRYCKAELLELLISQNLVGLVKIGELIDRIGKLRGELSTELDRKVPRIRIRDYIKLQDNECQFLIEGSLKDEFEVSADHPMDDIIRKLQTNIRKYNCLLPDRDNEDI